MPRRDGRDDDRRVESDSVEHAQRETAADRHARDRVDDRDRGSTERRDKDREPRYEPLVATEGREIEGWNRHTIEHSRGYDYDAPSTRRPSQQTTNSTRRPSITTAQTLSPAVPQLSSLSTLLSPLELSFARIPVGDYDSCKEFITNHPNILQQDANVYLREAAAAHRSGRSQYARSCVQQALLIRELKEESPRHRRYFFEDLADLKHKDVLIEFLDNFDTAIEAVQRSAGGPTAPAPLRPTGNGPVSYSQAVGDTIGRSHNDNPLPAMLGLNIQPTGDRPRYTPAPLSYSRETAPQGQHHDRHHRTLDAPPRLAQNTALVQGAPIRKGIPGDRFLDPNYTKRRDAKKFFHVGRIFALLWHEPAGSDGGSATSFKGENVYSNIRRMAVVKADIHGACWAVPIHTYGNKGVAKRGFNEIDVYGHAVIYMTGTTPYTAPDEPKMSKTPIQVDPAQDKSQELDPKKTRLDLKKIRLEPMSRINFTKVHTVEHEVKVLNIGIVSKKAMPDFEQFWAEQTQTRPSR